MALLAFQMMFVFCMCYAVVSDFRELLIPNWIVVTLVAAFPPFAVCYLEPMTAFWHVLIALAVLALTVAFFAVNWIGGGDVKLMTGVALWAGPQHFVNFLLAMSVLGSLLAIVLIALRTYGVLATPWLPNNSLVRRLEALAKEGQCPYGVAIGAAALAAVPLTFQQ
jgi:prepilin peptidase CpaA